MKMTKRHLLILLVPLFAVTLSRRPAPATLATQAPLDAAAIDAALAAKWPAAKLAPSAPATDDVFLRRVYLDLAGVIPPYDEIVRYTQNTGDRKAAVVDQLLASPRFAEHWGETLRHVVLGRKTADQFQVARAFDAWLADRIQHGAGLDRVARDVLTAEGTPLDNPAVAAIEQFEDSKEDMAGHFAKVFLGVQIQCAQCHDHPFEKWTRNDFYGMAAFFARARRTQIPEALYPALLEGKLRRADQVLTQMEGVKAEEREPTSGRYKNIQEALERYNQRLASAASDPLYYRPPTLVDGDGNPLMTMEAAPTMGGAMMMGGDKPAAAKPKRNQNLMYEGERGDLEMPPAVSEDPAKHKKGAIRPRFLTGEILPGQDQGLNRREVLALWMTAPENPFFARAMVNRVWAKLMGRGLVEPVDNVTNPNDPTHAPLLEGLASWFVQHKYDLRALVRLIVSTQAYRRSCQTTAENAKDQALYSHGLVRPLEPEQVLAAVLEATGLAHTFKSGQSKQFEDLRKNFTRQFVHQFQVDEPGESAKFHGTISQALFTMNSQVFARSTRGIAGSVIADLKTLPETHARIRALTLRVLSREPTPQEDRVLSDYVDRKILDGTWGQNAPQRAAGPKPASPQAASLAPKGIVVVDGLHPDAMWRAYEDVLWGMLASAEFQNNH